MLPRIAFLFPALLFTGSVLAHAGSAPPTRCREDNATMRDMYLRGNFATTPAIARLLAETINGRVPQVREQLSQMSPAAAVRWRQAAMITAVFAEQAGLVDALLSDGADVNATTRLPEFNGGSFNSTPTTAAQHTVSGSKAYYKAGPALFIAAGCADITTVNVLLRHHADAAARRPAGVPDALSLAVFQGNAAMVRTLLDHGADACADDRLAKQRRHAYETQHPGYEKKNPFASYAELGRRTGLPDDVVDRLTCSGFDTAGTPGH